MMALSRGVWVVVVSLPMIGAGCEHRRASGPADPSATADGGTPADGGMTPDGMMPDGGATPVEGACVMPATDALGDLGFGLGGTIRQSGDRMVTAEVTVPTGPWALWDLATGRPIMRGTDARGSLNDPPVAIAGSTVVIRRANDLAIRSALDGQLLAMVPYVDPPGGSTRFGVASDSSYLWKADANGLAAHDLSGDLLWEQSGLGYLVAASHGRIAADPLAVRIGDGPAGVGVLEIVEAATGTSSTVSYSGDFMAWFADSEHFLTELSGSPTVVWVYSKDAVEEQVLTHAGTPGLGGRGTYFWMVDVDTPTIEIYRIGTALPIAELPNGPSIRMFAGHDCIGVSTYGYGRVDVVRLGGTPETTTVELPMAYPVSATCSEAGMLYVSGAGGVVAAADLATAPTTARALNCGAAYSVAGSPSGTAAIATAAGQVLIIDTASDQIRTVLPIQSSKLQLTDDGLLLAAMGNRLWAQYSEDVSLRIVSLVAGEEGTSIALWPHEFDETPRFMDYEMARAAPRLAHLSWTFDPVGPDSNHRRWTDLDGSLVVMSDDYPDASPGWLEVYKLSPDGSRVAAPTGGRDSQCVTLLYDGSTPVGTVTGFPVGWIDDGRVLVARYTTDEFEVPVYAGSVIADPEGTVIGSPPLPEIDHVTPVAGHPDWIHSGTGIYDLITGQPVGAAQGLTAAGSRVIEIDGTGRLTTRAF